MKVIDFLLLNEVISELEKAQPAQNPITEEEKMIATERLYKEYQLAQSNMSEYRQQAINNRVSFNKLMYKNNYEEFAKHTNEDIDFLSKCEDDYLYLLCMLASSNERLVDQGKKIDKL